MSTASEDTNRAGAASPAPAHAPRSASPRPGTPLWARLLILAAFGCAGFVLLCMLLVAGAVWWVVSPPRQVATDALVAPTSIGVARMDSLADDAGLRGGLQCLSDEIRALQEEQAQRNTPGWVRRMQSERRGPPIGVLAMAVPDQATFVVERLPETGRLGWALAVNFPWLVRPFRFGHDSSDRRRVRRHTIDGVKVVEEHGEALCTAFVGGTFVMTSDLETMRVAVARLKAFRSGNEAVRLPAELPRTHEGWDVVGLLSDVRGDRAALLELLDEEADVREFAERGLAADFAGLGVGIDWETGDRMRAHVTIEVVDQLALEDWAAELEALMEEWVTLAEAEGMRLESRVDLQRDELRLDLTLDGVLQRLTKLVRDGQ